MAGTRLISTEGFKTHRSPKNPNYISIATSGGGHSSHRAANLIPITLELNADRNKDVLSKHITAASASTAEAFIKPLDSENVSEVPRPD